MKHKDQIRWWIATYNGISREVNNARTVSSGNTHPARTFVETKRTPNPHSRLVISLHHMRVATDTPAALFICAFAAHRAAWEEINGRDRSTRLWKITAAGAVIAALVAIITAISGGAASTLLVATVLALVLALAAWPVARWNLASKRDAFYHCLTHAVETAGQEAAQDYIDKGGFEHRTFLHNLDAGLPSTPNRIYKAIQQTYDKATV